MTIIEQIKAEIERRIKILREDEVVRQNCTSDFLEGKIYGYEEILSFLSTLESEKQKEVKPCNRTRKRLAEWSKTQEGRESYEKVAEEMRKQIVPKDLEEAAEEYRKRVCEHPMYYTFTK